jgi:catechol 2,3-dioxygenase-like lactoylglutathione lyase family enzyme
MIHQLAHANFSTERAEEMLAFYTKGLGLTVQFTLDGNDGKPLGWYLACGNRTFVEIFDRDRAAQKWPEAGGAPVKGNRFRHCCFEVDDLEGYKAALEARGIAVRGVWMGLDHSKQAWVTDPDGNDIELMEYTPASLQLRATAAGPTP